MTRVYSRDEVRSLRIRARRVAKTMTTGEMRYGARSPQGLDLADFREYQPGDDVGRIDWNVTARVGKPWVRLYAEETGFSVIVLADASPSVHSSLREIAARILSASVWSGHRTGLVLFSDRVRRYVPQASGPQHLARMIRELNREHADERLTDPSVALNYAAAMPQRSLVFLLSDFICEDFGVALRRCVQRHELVAIGVDGDPEIPSSGLTRFRDPETGRIQIIDTAHLAPLHEAARRRRERNTETLRSNQVRSLILTPGVNHLQSLARFLR
jgi:uncharacterized protein (DUF58 family)